MARTRFTVTPSKGGDGWDIRQNGEQVSHHRTKATAVDKATGAAKKSGNSQVVIRKQDGTIQEERTYGGDPHPPKG